ncbi:olfactory receptor-like protein OLF4 [Dasypus novemcinctus]|uniref:olfactory receptor-like protein OLF4 n=1 Tax=Dasypus novemcinctus TaxID=9361 RepID=UPI00062ABAF8|nr:olfactory receptor-like protein OLF4 [Dasypus novemcinctus]
MDQGNESQITEFLLLGLSEEPEMQPFLFGMFLSMYLVTICGNLLIIIAFISDSHLHTPMYFFLSNLSFVDICLTSTIVSKVLENLQTQSRVITYEACITQMYFFVLFEGLDVFLLTAMAYDRFVAICFPLHYMVIMNPWLCRLLVLVCWVISVLHSLLQSLLMLQLSFCAHFKIPHFFCELNEMVELACSDNFINEIMIYFGAGLLGGGALTAIFYSYSRIVSSIRAISSAQGKYKAFSTCLSHLSVVTLFFCTAIGVYFSSAASYSAHSNATASILYTVVTPMLNPFIYSLRNKDIKAALKKFFQNGAFKGIVLGLMKRQH